MRDDAYTRTNLSAATPAVANRFVTSVAMKNGAYTLANTTMPTTPGGRRITVGHTATSTVDTLGVITVVGTGLRGETITEVITPSNGVTVTGTKAFVTVTSVTGSGWASVAGDDLIVVGAAAGAIVLPMSGTLFAVCVNTTAAGTIVLADAGGTIATLKSSIAENTYYYQCAVFGYLMVTLGAASDVTIIHSFNTGTQA